MRIEPSTCTLEVTKSNALTNCVLSFVLKEICKGGNKSGLYGHMKMLIEKGKEADDSDVQLMNEEGETIADEEKVKDIIENFWGDLFCLKGNAIYGVEKELVDGGMKKEVWSINDQDLKRAIKLMKVNKATDESEQGNR